MPGTDATCSSSCRWNPISCSGCVYFCLPRQKYTQPEQLIGFHRQLLEQVASVPGIEYAGTVTALPYGGSTNGFGYTIDSSEPGGQTVSLVSQQASADFF